MNIAREIILTINEMVSHPSNQNAHASHGDEMMFLKENDTPTK